jgi:CubicO group peptidase (beta-lactamase class C family)
MKRASRAAAFAAAAWCLGGAARAEAPAGFDARVEQIRTAVGVPGLAVTIVERGRVTLARGYGVRRLGESAAVDADTIFQLGSVGKAFTTAALAVLADRGKIAWDDPVTRHIPWFQMYDPWVTREMTVVDLLVHRSGLGLGAGDLMFVPRSTLSRAETVRRLRYIRPATSFRSGYAYDNVLYVVAGQLVEEVSGKTWERFMREDVLVPAGMHTATADRVERRRTENRAWPHARRDGPMHGMGTQQALDDSGRAELDPELGQNAAPAGGVAASANDMGRWIAIQLARGALPEGDGRLFSEAAARQMWTPRVHLPISPSPGPTAAATPKFNSYALGWNATIAATG